MGSKQRQGPCLTPPARPVGNWRERREYRRKAVFSNAMTPDTWSPASGGRTCPGPRREHHKGLFSAKSEIPAETENGNCPLSSHTAGQVGTRQSIAFCKNPGIKADTDPCPQKADCQVERWKNEPRQITDQYKYYREKEEDLLI